ncbi:Heme O synthase, protoheme IX farnesyltransferase COX10-CtaB [hydrothermal vent metagenome]|uniref:Protoheme IX farnesyltransferase n=1 Tax=hydrothermal vent metagenome TaxID=652676 RepID=A0A3B0VML3_9ZZZZ
MNKSTFSQYLELTKPKVVLLIVFTALVGMLLSVDVGIPPLMTMVYGLVGIGFAAGSAAAINHWADQKIDAIMLRTQHRPLPQGELTDWNVIIFALVLCAISMAILITKINTLTAVLTFLSLVGYAFIYTFFLKRVTPQNIVIGGAAGAAPPVLGWTAITGNLTGDALLLFAIIYTWTPPHFWALAIHRVDDYAKAKIPMLPVTHGIKHTLLHIILYTILLFIISIFPYLVGMSGWVYLIGAIILGARFLQLVLQMRTSKDSMLPWKVFKYSIWYLMILFALLLIDHYLPVHNLNHKVFHAPLL